MVDYIISREDLRYFVDDLTKCCRVYAPVNTSGERRFERITNGHDVVLDEGNTVRPPKDILFPPAESLFSYRWDSKGAVCFEDIPADRTPTVVLGIRPCDAAAVQRLDAVFMEGSQKDDAYAARRQNTILISMACGQPGTTCFCTSVGGGPFATDGADAMLVALDDGYILRTLSDRGEQLAAERQWAIANGDQIALLEERRRVAEGTMSSIDIDGIQHQLGAMFDNAFWSGLHEKCLGCAACTYLCPTCHCFDLVDDSANSSGVRTRVWDSCMFASFTLQASGANPRSTQKERMRQRIMHKFKYFVDNYGRFGCVGCGRCIRSCPVNMDIRQVLTSVREVVLVGRENA